MYDKKSHKWRSDCSNEDLLKWSKEPGNQDQPESRFIRASELLSKSRRGGDVAEAVELMELAAKQGYPEAMFAMGQMYYWGWAVHKDKKLGMEWYRKAAQMKCEPAQKELDALKRRRIINITSVCAGVLAVLVLAAGAVYMLSGMSEMRVIKVHKNTELVEVPTLNDFIGEVADLVAQYDDELVISGQVSTNRLILRLDGNKLDLSDFMADRVVARDDNIIVIQFSSEEEARRCQEELRKLDSIVYADMDEYTVEIEELREEDSSLSIIDSVYNTKDYNSWGIADMGIDQLRDYVIENFPDRVVDIAIIDTGVAGYVAYYDNVVETFNVVTGESTHVPHEHGTHVTGIVLDGVYGTGARIHCLDVNNGGVGSSILTSILAFDMSIEVGVDVINRSMGSPQHVDAMVDAVQRAADAGIVVVVSAGNDAIEVNGATTHNCPKEVEDIIVVGAYDIDHNETWFTNYGSTVDVCAPGETIYSFDYEEEGMLIPLDGTSMAAPHVTALAALVKLINPDATPAEVEQGIKDYSRTYRNPDLYATGMYGAGAPDATRFIEKNPD